MKGHRCKHCERAAAVLEPTCLSQSSLPYRCRQGRRNRQNTTTLTRISAHAEAYVCMSRSRGTPTIESTHQHAAAAARCRVGFVSATTPQKENQSSPTPAPLLPNKPTALQSRHTRGRAPPSVGAVKQQGAPRSGGRGTPEAKLACGLTPPFPGTLQDTHRHEQLLPRVKQQPR